MESYVERFAREQKEKAQKESRKPQKGVHPKKERLSTAYGVMKKEVQKDGTDTRSEGHETPEDTNSGE